MSPTGDAKQAIEWLEQQLTELAGIRNATPRDPSFKNWRQATLTIMQRIWPNDQDRQERFRRIPFSPADPRADARTLREWYSRGCQEAGRVLNGFVADIRAQGVPNPAADVASKPSSGEFSVDFPTVDLPSGDLGSTATALREPDDTLRELVDNVGATGARSESAAPLLPMGPAPTPVHAPVVTPEAASVSPAASPFATPVEPPAPTPAANPAAAVGAQPKKGMGMKARLRDLLGFAQLSAKAFTGFSREQVPITPSSEPTSRTMHAAQQSVLPPMDQPLPPPPAPMLDIIPVGEEVLTRRPEGSAPVAVPPPITSQPELSMAASPYEAESEMSLTPPPPVQEAAPVTAAPVPASPLQPAVAATSPASPGEEVREPGMSVVMSRPTTLRASIEKVSIESLISPEFRTPNAEESPPAPAPRVGELPSAPVVAASPPPPVVSPSPAPPAVEAPPLAASPEPPAMRSTPPVAAQLPMRDQAPPAPLTPTPTVRIPALSAADLLPPLPSSFQLPVPPAVSASIPIAEPPKDEKPAVKPDVPKPVEAAATPESASKVVPLPKRSKPKPPVEEPIAEDATNPGEVRVDPEAFARATEDFMRSSPVLGATGRRVQRGYDDSSPESSGFDDADAIAVASIMEDLSALGVPATRQPELRARLLDLTRRLERGDLEWAALRKAVWFAMEYPELARRLMPVLLPWIDRAA